MKNKIRCVRIIHFCAGHRLLGHENKCATPHGHNYFAHITAEAESLDALGRVIDFAILKDKIGGWIDIHWDHTFLVNQDDHETIKALLMMPRHKEPFICPFNPTAEKIAQHLLMVVCPRELEGSGITVSKVKLYETENCYAEVSL